MTGVWSTGRQRVAFRETRLTRVIIIVVVVVNLIMVTLLLFFVGISVPLSLGMMRAHLLLAQTGMSSGAWPSRSVCHVNPVVIGVGVYSAPPDGQ